MLSFIVDKQATCVLKKMHNTKKYLHTFKSGFAQIKEATHQLFIAIVLFSRIKSFPQNLCSRSSKNYSSILKLETWSSKLDSQSSKIETPASKLNSLFSKTLRIENWVLSRDCQLTCTFEQYCKCSRSDHTKIDVLNYQLTFNNNIHHLVIW